MSKTARQAERQCCGSLVTGPHKMGCDYKMREDKAREKVRAAGGMSLAKMIEDFGNLPVPEIAGRQPVCKHCCCGPDMCADSVACPRR